MLPHDFPEWTVVYQQARRSMDAGGFEQAAQKRAQVVDLTAKVQENIGGTVEIAYVDQGYTGESASQQAAEYKIELKAVKHTEAKKVVCALAQTVGHRANPWLDGSVSAIQSRP